MNLNGAPHCLSIMATCGRNYLAKRSLTYFLNQDYKGKHTLLIHNNSHISCTLDLPNDIPEEKTVILVNNHISKETGLPYTNLGEIYRDSITYIPEGIDIITFQDDDDAYLDNHISEGVKGWLKAKQQDKIAYKPKKSYFRTVKGVELIENTLEPSIFVEAKHVIKHGFSSETTAQHLQWVNPLVYNKQILVDEEGLPTLIYDWSQPVPTYKTSGDPNNPKNFENYRNFSTKHGDRIFKPLSKEEMEKYAI